MRRSIGIALLLLAAVVSRADVPVAPRETGPSAELNLNPLLVADGNELVVIWFSAGQSQFARIRHTDEVLLTGDFGRPGQALAAVDGPGRSVLAAFGDAEGIHVATITRAGEVRISEPVATSFSSMAWNGSALLIVTRTGDTILTDANGRILGQGPHLALPDDGMSSASVRGSGFVVAWTERETIYVTTLTSNGAVAHEQVIANRPVGAVAIGCRDAGTCLLLSAVREPLSGQILGTSPGPLFRISEDLGSVPLPPVWDGSRFLVLWNDHAFGEESVQVITRVAAVALDGTVTPVATIDLPDRTPAAAGIARTSGGPVIVMWESTRCGFSGAQIVAHSLATGRELRLTHGLSEQNEPAIAGTGTGNALIAWTERGGTARIRGRIFPFTAPAFDVSPGPSSANPVVGTDGSGYLVAWRESLPEEDCRNALRISAVGSETIHTLAHGVDFPIRITWNGSEYVVLWEQDDPAQLFAMRVDRSGQPLDFAPLPLTTPEEDPDSYTTIDHEPAGLFRTSNGYVLVWRRSRSTYIPLYPDPPPQFDIRTTVLSPNLIPTGPPQTIAPYYTVVAAAKGDTILALWTGSGQTLHAARIGTDGSVLEQRDLGIKALPWRIIPTLSGFAALTPYEILFLDGVSLTGRRASPSSTASIAETSAGLVTVYSSDDAVYVATPLPGKRRALR